jgi:Tfp pilus assembly protein PilF
MKPVIRAFLIAAVTTIAAVAQQDTNPPPAESQSPGIQVGDQSNEERIEFLIDLGSAYFSENDPASAITAYERILQIDPTNKQARYMSSYAYIASKQYAKAEEKLISLIEEFPEDADVKNNLAWLYATAEDPEFRHGQKAIQLAQEAMILTPNDHHVWSTLAETYYSTGQYEKAFRAISHMMSLAQRYRSNLTQEMVNSYNEQFRKCKRSLDIENAFQGDEEEPPESPLSVDENTQEQQD